jgi:hypothetical protein
MNLEEIKSIDDVVVYLKKALGDNKYNNIHPNKENILVKKVNEIIGNESIYKEYVIEKNGLKIEFAQKFTRKELNRLRIIMVKINPEIYGGDFVYYTTVEDIANKNFEIVEKYKVNPDDKEVNDEAKKELERIYGNKAELWKKVASMNKIKSGFIAKMQKERLEILRRLLKEMYGEKYEAWDWEKYQKKETIKK